MFLRYSLILLVFPTLAYADPDQIVKPPAAVQIMQSHTEEKKVSDRFAGMAEAQAFAENPSNRCTTSTTSDFCFTRLETSAIGASTTMGTNACPPNYSAVLAFGNRVLVQGTNQVVVFTQGDVRTRVSRQEYDYYRKRDYTCEADSASVMVSQTIYSKNSNNGGYVINDFNDPNGFFMYTTEILAAAKLCYTLPHVIAPSTSCEWGLVVGAYWEYTFYVNGYTVKCTRSPGFWPPNPTNPSYPLPSAGTEFSPTTVLCAKSYIVWRPKQ